MDSLDVMFDTTAYGEYQSYSNLPLNHEEEDDDGDEEEEKHYEDNSGEHLYLTIKQKIFNLL